MNIIPFPNEITVKNEELIIENSIRFENAELNLQASKYLYDALQVAIPSISATDNSNIYVSYVYDASLEEERYIIDISRTGITVKSSSKGGFLYSSMTLKQLVFEGTATDHKTITLECVIIDDKPRYKWRGFLLDESRHFFGVSRVKKLLDAMAFHKLNVFHWHLSDDQGYRVESDVFPLLTQISTSRADTQLNSPTSDSFCGLEYSAYYTKDQIREIVQYASDLNINIIPELDMPGHFSAILSAYPELSCTGEKIAVATRFGILDNIGCPSNENLYEFCHKLIDEWCELFPFEYFHIGGDEIKYEKWHKCRKCQEFMKEKGFTDEKQLHNYFMDNLITYLKSKGKTTVGWNESLTDETDSNFVAQYWTPNKDVNVEKHLAKGNKVIVSNMLSLYFDHTYALIPLKKTYNFEPESLFVSNLENIMGVEATLWTEWVYDNYKFDVNIFPRMAALSEICWCKKDRKNFKNFTKRLSLYFKILDNDGYYYAKKKIYMASNALRRLHSITYWMFKDKYIEIRKNREL